MRGSRKSDSAEAITADSAVSVLRGVGPGRARSLAASGLHTLRDLLFFVPIRYWTRPPIQTLATLEQGTDATVIGCIQSVRRIRMRSRRDAAVVVVEDESGSAEAVFMGQGYLARSTFAGGMRVRLSGRVAWKKKPVFYNPHFEALGDGADEAVGAAAETPEPVYAEIEGVQCKSVRGLVAQALPHAVDVADPVPAPMRVQHGLLAIGDALRRIHAPVDQRDIDLARRTLGFAWCYLRQRRLRDLRERRKERAGIAHEHTGARLQAMRAALPFEPTPGQRQAIAEILHDMASPWPMRRVLHGDVGCGKTLVAAHALVCAVDSGRQAALLAPTDVLARQHAQRLDALLSPLRIRTVLLTASADTAQVRREIRDGRCDVVVGTHALFQEATAFARLGLVVVDEQHRFGVAQRERLVRKAGHVAPDVLQMSATPIPRTMALTGLGDADITVIPDRPPGREPVRTRWLSDSDRAVAYDHIHAEAERGRQTLFVCPQIDGESAQGVLTHVAHLAKGPLSKLRLLPLHGRMAPEEKQHTIATLANGDADVMVATSVVEVGVDLPRLSTIVIEDAPRFGLAQLHQMRGRVGRGPGSAHCFLLGEASTPQGRSKLDTLVREPDGFRIAEADLRLRGPGDVEGTRQSGFARATFAQWAAEANVLDAVEDALSQNSRSA